MCNDEGIVPFELIEEYIAVHQTFQKISRQTSKYLDNIRISQEHSSCCK